MEEEEEEEMNGCEGGRVVSCQLEGALAGTGWRRRFTGLPNTGGGVTESARGAGDGGGAERSPPGALKKHPSSLNSSESLLFIKDVRVQIGPGSAPFLFLPPPATQLTTWQHDAALIG